MKKAIYIVMVCSALTCACGDSPQQESTGADVQTPGVSTQADDRPSAEFDEDAAEEHELAEVPPRVEVNSGFELMDIASPALSPVVAIARDATELTAFVDMTDGWPRVRLMRENDPVIVPGRENFMVAGEITNALSLTADDNSVFHLVFDIAGKVLYSRIEVSARTHGASISTPVVVHEERARDASVAIAPNGEIVVSYTVDAVPDSGESPVVMITRGEHTENGAVFNEAVAVNPDCCVDDFGEERPPHAMSGPSLAIDAQGRAHVIYEWSLFGLTVIDYAHDDGADSVLDPRRIAEAAFSPCPALALDDQGVVHITYILERQRNVWHVSIDAGAITEPVSLYESDRRIYLALMKMDADNQMHLAIKEANSERGEKLTYVAVDEDSQTQRVIAEATDFGFFKLTPRMGGMVLASDAVYLPFERALSTDDHGYLELAIGR